DDVFDDEDVAIAQVDLEVLLDPDDPAGAGGRSIRRDGHEVELDGEVDGPGQVAHEHEGALEDPDEEGGMVRVVGGDLLAELRHPLLELLGPDDLLAEMRIVHLCRSLSSPARSRTLVVSLRV